MESCSVDRTLQTLSDPWSFLVLRELWFGLKRFDEFQGTLRIPRATLSNRLKALREAGLLMQVPSPQGGLRKEYRFTEKGADLYPVMLTLLRWGDRWKNGDAGIPLHLTHHACGKRLVTEVVYSCCGTKVNAKDVEYQDGPGAGVEPAAAGSKTNRSSKPDKFTLPRACSVARTLQVMGDRWSFLVIREMFFGRHRFDEIQKRVGIATNILSNRIKLLMSHDILERSNYGAGSTRYEYHLTASGMDLYASFLAMMRWGDHWLSEEQGAPLILRHKKCGKVFEPEVVCKQCRLPLVAHEVHYKPGPGWDVNFGEDILAHTMLPRK
ncbi:hypothetical protein A9Q99_13220 [Gammaproteobacteria bacterium 45_16_T64]|nr:hypothetical protein A9Q99_13220 [Gammaproteobacteria bacterium 45_16_T64]